MRPSALLYTEKAPLKGKTIWMKAEWGTSGFWFHYYFHLHSIILCPYTNSLQLYRCSVNSKRFCCHSDVGTGSKPFFFQKFCLTCTYKWCDSSLKITGPSWTRMRKDLLYLLFILLSAQDDWVNSGIRQSMQTLKTLYRLQLYIVCRVNDH